VHLDNLNANQAGMVDNYEYSNFKNLTSRLSHQTGLCVGNLVPHFQHIVTVGPGRVREGDECPRQG